MVDESIENFKNLILQYKGKPLPDELMAALIELLNKTAAAKSAVQIVKEMEQAIHRMEIEQNITDTEFSINLNLNIPFNSKLVHWLIWHQV